MSNVYKSNIPAGAKRGATLLADRGSAERLGKKERANNILDGIDKAVDTSYAQAQALKVKSLDNLANITQLLSEKCGTTFTFGILIAAAAALGVTVHEAANLIDNGKLSGDFSTPALAVSTIITGGMMSLLATEGISGVLRDFLKRDPDVNDAYERLTAGSDPSLGRIFQSMLPKEREKASELVGLLTKLHPGNTSLLQAEIRTLIDILNITDPKDYSSELDHQIKTVRSQMVLYKQDREAEVTRPVHNKSQMDMV